MLHVPQQLNFPQSAFRIDLIVESVTNLLDGDLLASLCIDSSTVRTQGRQVNIRSSTHTYMFKVIADSRS
jgi:hypothetical protein